ncbi:MAG: glycine cleavage system protein H [Candidatus Lokiarchaeota archaeon]|nr:glycine cleavage system protein H [Candidatus Lokiarchaeota archaeon]
MAKIPDNLLFTRTHQWVKMDGGVATVGLTDFAQEQLGEIVYVELSWDEGLVGKQLTAVKYDAKGEPASDPISGVSVESQKAVGDVYAPISGEVVAVNEDLKDAPESINSDPYGKGWLFKIKASAWDGEKGSLLTPAKYKEIAQ